MTPVKRQLSKFQTDKILPRGLQRVMAVHERLLSESSRPYMSAFTDCAYFLVSCLEEKT
jgi:hypothetical protein